MNAFTLSPPAARVFLNAADAWHPLRKDRDRPGASRVDLLAHLDHCVEAEELRRLELRLRLLEWFPRLWFRRRGFSWLSRPERRAMLRRLEVTRCGPARRRVLRLRAIVDACYKAARAQSSSPSA